MNILLLLNQLKCTSMVAVTQNLSLPLKPVFSGEKISTHKHICCHTFLTIVPRIKFFLFKTRNSRHCLSISISCSFISESGLVFKFSFLNFLSNSLKIETLFWINTIAHTPPWKTSYRFEFFQKIGYSSKIFQTLTRRSLSKIFRISHTTNSFSGSSSSARNSFFRSFLQAPLGGLKIFTHLPVDRQNSQMS